jgi:hypothetical protein
MEPFMAKYFFHVLDGKLTIDSEGSELAGIKEARDEAIHTSGEILRSRGAQLNGRPWRMIVADAEGTVLYSLEFSADHHGL